MYSFKLGPTKNKALPQPNALHTKTAQLFRQKFYFPNFVDFLTNYKKNCSSCLQVKPDKHANLKPHLQPLAVDQHFSRDLLQVDFVGKLSNSGDFTHILTAKDVFSKYTFAIPMQCKCSKCC